jgi:hypothetical protein
LLSHFFPKPSASGKGKRPKLNISRSIGSAVAREDVFGKAIVLLLREQTQGTLTQIEGDLSEAAGRGGGVPKGYCR